MQIVIEIDDGRYKQLMTDDIYIDVPIFREDIIAALPKGHGRLIDANELINATDHCRQPDFRFYVQGLVKEIPTIIEADKEVSDA